MKRNMIIYLILIAIMMLAGCEGRLYTYVVTLKKSKLIVLDQTGAFNKTELITAAEIRDALDLPEDAKIKRIDIESVFLVVEPGEGNQAEAFVISGYTMEGSTKKYIFKDKNVNFEEGVNVGLGLRIKLETLIELGIKRLAKQINDHLALLNTANIVIGVEGNTVPPGRRLVVDVFFNIVATVQYEQCTQVVWFFGGEKCEPADSE